MGIRDGVRSLFGVIGAVFLGLMVIVVGIIDFVAEQAVALSILGSIWFAITGEWQTALVVLLVAIAASWFVFGS